MTNWQSHVDPACIFCKIVAGSIPAHKVYEDAATLAFLDIAPMGRGHTLILPKYHAADLEGLPEEVLLATARATQAVARMLRTRLNVVGLNVFQNNGAAAGQEVFHYHVHLMPRQPGDAVPFGRREPTEPAALATLAALIRDEA